MLMVVSTGMLAEATADATLLALTVGTPPVVSGGLTLVAGIVQCAIVSVVQDCVLVVAVRFALAVFPVSRFVLMNRCPVVFA